LVEVNCETDFVARNEELLGFGSSIAELVMKSNPVDVAALSPAVEGRRQALVQKIGENISIRRFSRLGAKGRIASYLHGTRIGVLVDYEGTEETGKDLALHIAFARPQYMSRGDVPQDVMLRERGILAARAAESGKAPDIAAKMVEGGLNKFTGEMSLLGQPFVKDEKQTVEKMLTTRKAMVHAFRFLVVGEGIERKSGDFAAEVAAMVKAS
jgi:elongation factor Ts